MKSSLVKKAFNKAADQYDISCELQLQSGAVLIDLLKNYAINNPNILDAGCGTGIVTKKLASAFNHKEFYAIDIADRLLAHAKTKLTPLNIHVQSADYNNIHHLPVLFDIIYANLSLHWSDNLINTLTSLQSKLSETGVLAFSIPLSGTFQEIQNYCSINRFHESASIEEQISQAGFQLAHTHNHLITFEFDDILTALKSIKSVGTHYVAEEHRNKLGFTNLRKFIQSNYNSFKLSYNIGYFIVKK